MKEELKRREYCKTTSLTKSLIAFVVCLVCFVFFLFWSPSRELAKKDVKIVLKEDCNKWIYVWSGESGKLEETNETLKAGTSLKGIAEDGRWTWIVEDENGNRFGVPKLAVEGEVKELRAINPDFRYVYRADSLTGFSLERIRKEAGDYLMADVSTRSYYFPQVVLAKGEGRTKGVLLTVDEQGLVIHTERTSELKYNLYTSAPFFYYIISWNLVTNFQPFTVDANSQPLHHKSLSSKFGSVFMGIFSSIYFVINFACMLLGGIHPVLWMLMPGFIAVFADIPFMLMVAKVQNPGAVFLMWLITALIYFATGQFTLVILISMASTCILAEVVRMVTKYNSFKGNSIAYVIFSLGMVGSPLPIWLFKADFLAQITEQGMPADYVAAVEALSSNAMLIVLFVAPIIGGIIGAFIARGLFKKHFVKAGIV